MAVMTFVDVAGAAAGLERDESGEQDEARPAEADRRGRVLGRGAVPRPLPVLHPARGQCAAARTVTLPAANQFMHGLLSCATCYYMYYTF